MKLFQLDAQTGRTIDRFDSIGASYAQITHTNGKVQIGCMRVAADGIVGYHQAVTPQLFVVVSGHGWVTGVDRQRTPIRSGQVAFWDAGEWHESGTEVGMTAIVIESEAMSVSL